MSEDDNSQDRIDQLIERLDYLEQILREQSGRLYYIEQRLGLIYRPPQPQQSTQPIPTEQTTTESAGPPAPPMQPVQPAAPIPPPSIRPMPVRPAPPVTQPVASHAETMKMPPPAADARRKDLNTGSDLETRIGGSWLGRIGIIAISIGVAFFLKLAIDSEWIGPRGQVVIGAVIGLGFLVAGERLRSRYASYAYGLTGGGILILYLSIYAAFAFYELMPQLPAFMCMALVTTMAALLAARYSALPIAILSLIGGFLTPFLLSTGTNNEIGLFGYIALLDAGVLALAYRKQWRSLNYMAFGATVFTVAAWMDQYYEQSALWLTIFFLTLFFSIFAMLAVLYNIINRRPTTWADLVLVFINALLYFGTSYVLLYEYDVYRGGLGLFAVLMAAFYLALGYVTYRRDREDYLLVHTFLGLAFLFAVLAIPIQFDQHWVTMGWAIEGAVMTWVGLRSNDRISRLGALVVFIIAGVHWAIDDFRKFAYEADQSSILLLNRATLSCIVLVATLACGVWLYKRFGSNVEPGERSRFIGAYTFGAILFAVLAIPIQFDWHWVTIGWATEAAAMTWLGLKTNDRLSRFASLVVFIIAASHWLTIDVGDFSQAPDPSFTPLLNPRALSCAVLVAALACAAWLYKRLGSNVEAGERAGFAGIYTVGANLLVVTLASFDINGYFQQKAASAQPVAQDSDLLRGFIGWSEIDNARQLALSALWIIYGLASVAFGIQRASKPLRWWGIALLAVATAKVLAVDSWYYSAEWNALIFNYTFAAFALLVVALGSSIWLYSHAASVSDEERSSLLPVLVVAVNLVAVLALSLEAYGHFEKQMAIGDEATDDSRLAKQLSLSVIWTVYGGALLVFGIVKRELMLRVMALALLAVTIVKVFLVDLSSLKTIYRIISFVVLGGVLLAVSFLYQRYRRPLEELLGDDDQEAPAQST